MMFSVAPRGQPVATGCGQSRKVSSGASPGGAPGQRTRDIFSVRVHFPSWEVLWVQVPCLCFSKGHGHCSEGQTSHGFPGLVEVTARVRVLSRVHQSPCASTVCFKNRLLPLPLASPRPLGPAKLGCSVFSAGHSSLGHSCQSSGFLTWKALGTFCQHRLGCPARLVAHNGRTGQEGRGESGPESGPIGLDKWGGLVSGAREGTQGGCSWPSTGEATVPASEHRAACTAPLRLNVPGPVAAAGFTKPRDPENR